MKYRSVLAFLVLCTAAQAGEVEAPQAPITPERAAQCEQGGGCVYVTRAEVNDFLAKLGQQAYEAGRRHERETCGSRTGYGL